MAQHDIEALAVLLRAGWPYRKAASRWVGGEHTVRVAITSQPGATCESRTVWHKRHTWKGTNSSAQINVTQGAIELLDGNVLCNNVIVLDARRTTTSGVLAVTYARQSTGVSLTLGHGFLIHGRLIAATSEQAALRKAAKLATTRLAA